MKLNYSSLQHAVLPGRGGRRGPGRGAAARSACSSSTGSSRRCAGRSPAEAPGCRVGLRADRRRRAARRRSPRSSASCASAACSPPTHRRPGLRRRGRGDHHGRGARPRPAGRGWDVALCGPGPGILGSASRLGHGGHDRARLRARRARPRPPHGRRAAHVGRRPARAPSRRLPPLADGARAAARAGRRRAARRATGRRPRPSATSCAAPPPTSTATAPAAFPRAPWAATWRTTRPSSRRRSPGGAVLADIIRAAMSSRFERIASRERLGRADRERARGALPPRGRRGGRARGRRPPRRGRGRRARRRVTSTSSASRARRSACPTCSSCRAGKLDEEGEDAAGDRQARARRGDRQGGRALGAPQHVLVEPGLLRRADPRVPGHRPQRRRRPRSTDDERIDVETWPLDRLDELIDACHDAKSLIGLLELRPAGGRRA